MYTTPKKPWDGRAKNDKIIGRIRGVITRVKTDGDKGMYKYKDTKGSKSKTILTGAWGRQATDPVKKVSRLVGFFVTTTTLHVQA